MNKQKIDLSKPFIVASGEDVLVEVTDNITSSWHKYYVANYDGEYYWCWKELKTGDECNYDIQNKVVPFTHARHIPEITDEELHALAVDRTLWWKTDGGDYLSISSYGPGLAFPYFVDRNLGKPLSWFRNREYIKTPPFKSLD